MTESNISFGFWARASGVATLGCVLGSLVLALGATWAFAGPQQKTNAPQKAKPATESAAASVEFKKLAARANQARQQNQTQEAVELYEKALKLNPRWQEGWWYLGTFDYDANKYDDGVKAFRNLVELNRANTPALALLGLCEFETHDYGNAFVHLQMAQSNNSALSDEIWHVVEYHLALLEILHGDFDMANKQLAELVHQNILSANVKMALGLTLLRVPVLPDQIDPGKDALVSEAGKTGELMALSDFDEADKSFQQLIRDYPATPFVHYAHAAMLSELSQYEKAEEELREELKVNPDSAVPCMLLAYVDVRLNRFRDALPWAQESVKLAPQSFAAHYLLGRALLATNQVTDAVNEFTTAKRLAPESAETRYNLAVALAKAKRPEEAAAEQAEFRRLSALAQSKRSGGASEAKIPPGNSSAPGEITPDQLKTTPANDPHQ